MQMNIENQEIKNVEDCCEVLVSHYTPAQLYENKIKLLVFLLDENVFCNLSEGLRNTFTDMLDKERKFYSRLNFLEQQKSNLPISK